MCLIDEAKVHHAEEYFRKHGAASTFFGRLIPAVRQLISIPAGLAGMKLGPFLLYINYLRRNMEHNTGVARLISYTGSPISKQPMTSMY